MKTQHHLPDEVLMAYASGDIAPATELLVAAHLVLCPRCRGVVEEMEALIATWFDPSSVAESPQDVDFDLDTVMEALDEESSVPEEIPQTVTHPDLLPGSLALPGPISQALQGNDSTWKRVIPGLVHQIVLPLDLNGTPVRLLRVRGGFYVPPHTHRGMELNMVLCGGYHDKDVGFERGDVQWADDTITHDLHIDRGEECVILSVKEALLVPVGLRATITNWLIGGI